MPKEINIKKCRLIKDELHIQVVSGEGYVFTLEEILLNCAGGLTKRAGDKCPACAGKGWFGAQFCEGEECPTCEGTGICA